MPCRFLPSFSLRSVTYWLASNTTSVSSLSETPIATPESSSGSSNASRSSSTSNTDTAVRASVPRLTQAAQNLALQGTPEITALESCPLVDSDHIPFQSTVDSNSLKPEDMGLRHITPPTSAVELKTMKFPDKSPSLHETGLRPTHQPSSEKMPRKLTCMYYQYLTRS